MTREDVVTFSRNNFSLV